MPAVFRAYTYFYSAVCETSSPSHLSEGVTFQMTSLSPLTGNWNLPLPIDKWATGRKHFIVKSPHRFPMSFSHAQSLQDTSSAIFLSTPLIISHYPPLIIIIPPNQGLDILMQLRQVSAHLPTEEAQPSKYNEQFSPHY